MGSLFSAAAAPAVAAAPPKVDEKALALAYDMYQRAHPDDLLGLAAVAQQHGLTIEGFTVPALGVYGLAPAEAQQVVNRARAATRAAEAAPSSVRPATFEDKFSVSASYGLLTSGQYLVQGNWNFNDAFAGGLGPLDAAAIEWGTNCFTPRGGQSTYWNVYDYQGNDFSGLASIRTASPNAGTTVLQISDKVSGFKTQYDNGNLRVFGFRKCAVRLAFQYEHNQGSDRTWSAGVSLGVLSLSYGGGGVDRGQKSTGITGD